jgi:hypothetical protein
MAPAAGPPAAPPPPPPPPSLAAPPGPPVAAAAAPAGTATAAALVAPIAPQGTVTQPDAVTPQTARVRPPTVRPSAPTRRLRPGDLVCGDCGEGNAAERKFCSRCGGSLATAETVRTPWYRKLLPRRRPKTLAAGERPGKAGASGRRRAPSVAGLGRRLRMLVALVLLLGGLLYGMFAPFRNAVNERVGPMKQRVTAKIFGAYDPVSATEAAGTSEVRGHPATAAIDGFRNTFWQAPGRDGQPTLVLSFARPVNLDRMLLRSGSSTAFQGQGRPKLLHLVYSTGKTADVPVKDTPDSQELKLPDGHDVTKVEIHITEIYTSLKGHDTAITEIELFAKK